MIKGDLTITITPTADGMNEYVQIMSEDMVSINIVLIAEFINVVDIRGNEDHSIEVEDLEGDDG